MGISPHERIQQALNEHPVVLFMKGSRGSPACGFSAKAVEILDQFLPDYETVDVLRDPAIRDGIKEYSNWPTIPQLYVKGEFVGGSDIMAALFESGELEEKLGDLARLSELRITLSDRAIKELKAAIEEPGEAVRLDVTPRFEHDLAIGIPDPRDIKVQLSGLVVAVGRAAAMRAQGIHIDVVDTKDGPSFKIDNPNEPARVQAITATDLEQRLKAEPDLLLIDVRPPEEQEMAAIANSRTLDEGLLDELSASKNRPLVLICHHGTRSQRAAEELVGRGFRRVFNLRGGIDSWSLDVDPDVPRY